MSRTVRMPLAVWKAVDDDADKNRRSSNQHVLWLIEQALKAQVQE